MSASSRQALAAQGSSVSQDAAANASGAATETAVAIAIWIDQQREIIGSPCSDASTTSVSRSRPRHNCLFESKAPSARRHPQARSIQGLSASQAQASYADCILSYIIFGGLPIFGAHVRAHAADRSAPLQERFLCCRCRDFYSACWHLPVWARPITSINVRAPKGSCTGIRLVPRASRSSRSHRA